MKIRRAKKSDYEEVIALYADFVNQVDRYTNTGNDSFDRALETPDYHIYLAQNGKRIVGFITFSKRIVVRYAKPIVEVEEFYVVPDLRRQGIGRKLMHEALAFAQQNDCQYVYVASSNDRISAHRFYKAMDFDEYGFHYRRKP